MYRTHNCYIVSDDTNQNFTLTYNKYSLGDNYVKLDFDDEKIYPDCYVNVEIENGYMTLYDKDYIYDIFTKDNMLSNLEFE
jgi:hypothetical protein